MRAYVETILPPERHAEVLRALADLPAQRLAAMNPIQAHDEVELAIERVRGPQATRRTGTAVCAAARGPLALAQARWIAARLAEHGIASTIQEDDGSGADYAVRSCDDLRGVDPARIVAISQREDPRDAFISDAYASFASLPPGARVGASGRCRQAQLARLRGDLTYDAAPGDIAEGLQRVREGQYDALVLPAASPARLRRSAAHTVPFAISDVLPAAGQGALAVELLAGDEALAAALREAVNDDAGERCVRCEFAALEAMGPARAARAAVYAAFEGERLTARAALALPDGIATATVERTVRSVEEAHALGAALAHELAAARVREENAARMPMGAAETAQE